MGLPCWPWLFFFLGGVGGDDKPAMGLPCWLIVTINNITNKGAWASIRVLPAVGLPRWQLQLRALRY